MKVRHVKLSWKRKIYSLTVSLEKTESNIQLREFDTGLIGMRLQKLKNKLGKILYTVFSGL
jgi:hypothetical protein